MLLVNLSLNVYKTRCVLLECHATVYGIGRPRNESRLIAQQKRDQHAHLFCGAFSLDGPSHFTDITSRTICLLQHLCIDRSSKQGISPRESVWSPQWNAYGATAFTLIFLSPASAAATLVKASTADLLAAYAIAFGKPTLAEILAIFTIDPPSSSTLSSAR